MTETYHEQPVPILEHEDEIADTLFLVPATIEVPKGWLLKGSLHALQLERCIDLCTRDDDEAECTIALMRALDDFDITVTFTDTDELSVDRGGTYLVCTEREMLSRWDDALESTLEGVLADLPDVAQTYFDRGAWKRDARVDGAGHALASYDGQMLEEQVNDTWYFIFRTN